jgi:hypothetical protein
MDNPTLLRTAGCEQLQPMFSKLASSDVVLSARERNALEAFNASFFYPGADPRFLLLMTAIEALLDPRPRSPEAIAHVEQLIGATDGNDKLSAGEKASMLGALGWLRKESIRQAGRRVVAARVGAAEYDGLSAVKFFSHCYDVRSRLVHGLDPFPAWDEVNLINGPLERFVSDLITAPFLEGRS